MKIHAKIPEMILTPGLGILFFKNQHSPITPIISLVLIVPGIKEKQIL